jgi:uncharacterized membrane protein YeaQ/YmgE (transglycosylase-associated protein family)
VREQEAAYRPVRLGEGLGVNTFVWGTVLTGFVILWSRADSREQEGGDDVDLIIQLVLGAVGGNLGGALLKNLSLGTVGNSIAGIVGGGLGGQILSAVLGGAGGAAAAGGGMLGNIAGGGIGGIVVMVIVGLIKNAMGKK